MCPPASYRTVYGIRQAHTWIRDLGSSVQLQGWWHNSPPFCRGKWGPIVLLEADGGPLSALKCCLHFFAWWPHVVSQKLLDFFRAVKILSFQITAVSYLDQAHPGFSSDAEVDQ